MREHPILFSAPMVRAILDGRKSQTRRVVKPKYDPANWDWDPKDKNYGPWVQDEYGDHYKATDYAPWQTGDRLWVRETWTSACPYPISNCPPGKPKQISHVCDVCDLNKPYYFRADMGEIMMESKWKPSIFMPRVASRITLEVTDLRVERVQDITYDDCISEGMWNYGTDVDTLAAFQDLWDSINAKKGYGWGKNPWVWVIEFRRVDA